MAILIRGAWAASIPAFALAAPALARDIRVTDQHGYAAAVGSLRPGDALVLADGEWRDFAATLVAEGTAAEPITLRAEHPGKVVFTGRSSLGIAGKHLVVENLVFRRGYASRDEVIATRVGKRWAEHVRMTGIVIDGFSNPDRRFEDHWVALYGRDIRVDHSQFQGKANNGAMMIVVREQPWPLDNAVRIDHNFFGPRPVLGSNGGETIRIGTSTESMSDSKSVVEDNWFEHCDGEVEIISVKSGANIIRGNSFVESQGSVVLRHGNGNIVERNVFLGRGVPHTGGVRVINERQTVRDNYMEGLAGTDFTSAITVMNGVPNSPINRYVPVKDAIISRNTIVDAARITLAAGASAERSQPPATTRFADNLIAGRADPFRAEASIAGITFGGNIASVASSVPGVSVTSRAVTLTRAANGLLYPADPVLVGVGAPRDLTPISRAATGVAWYAKPAATIKVSFGTGATVTVVGSAALPRKVARASAGDTLRLRPGRYRVTAPLIIDRPLTIAGKGATIAFETPTLFKIEDGGSLRLEGLTISGAEAPHRPGNAVIRTSARPMIANYRIEIANCDVRELVSAPGFDVIATTPATFGERIAFDGGSVANVSGAIIAGHSETGKQGYYNAERVTITRTRLDHVAIVVDLFRGGTDESTYGPQFVMTGTTVTDSGPIRLWGVQEADITDNRFVRSRGIAVAHGVGSPHTSITGNVFASTPLPIVDELDDSGPVRATIAGNRTTG